MGVVLWLIVFIAGLQLGIYEGKRSVPEAVKLGMMKDINRAAERNAIERLKRVEVE